MANHSLSRTKFYKRHYEAIALAMQDARFRLRSSPLDQWECTIKCLANMLADDNGRFDRDRFIRACQPGANVRARTNGGAKPLTEEQEDDTLKDRFVDTLQTCLRRTNIRN